MFKTIIQLVQYIPDTVYEKYNTTYTAKKCLIIHMRIIINNSFCMTVVNHCMIEGFGPVCNHKNGVEIMCGKELERISIESGAENCFYLKWN